MTRWQEDLLNLLTGQANCAQDIFARIQKAATALGFDHVAYGFQAAYPLTKPQITLLNNYPTAWQEHYMLARYLDSDPTVTHARQCQSPILWSDQTFISTPQLWADAQDHGLRVGWAQSCLDSIGTGSMLTLCRSKEALIAKELAAREQQMRWLVQIAHVTCSKILLKEEVASLPHLSPREQEVLQWTADGKSAQDIADILVVSKHVVHFHIKNSVDKLQVTNKTAAVAKAILLGLLS